MYPRGLPTGAKVLSPDIRFPNLEGPAPGRLALGVFVKASRAKLQEPLRTRGNRDSTPQISHTLGPRARAVIDKSLGQTYLQVLESLLDRHLQLTLGT